MAKQTNKGTSEKGRRVKVDKFQAPVGELSDKEMKNIEGGTQANSKVTSKGSTNGGTNGLFEIEDF